MGQPPKHPTLLALGYSEAAMLLAEPHGLKIDAVISIHGVHEYAVDASSVAHRLVLRFDDVEGIDWSDPARAEAAWARQKWAKEIGRPLTPPAMDDAQTIIDFARRTADCNGAVLCQCQAGISRSPAAALLCLATWTGEGHEHYCIDRLLRIRPAAVPLRDLIAFGDTLLERQGALLRASMNRRQIG
jgi:predicted protein tyrosine phosphatase